MLRSLNSPAMLSDGYNAAHFFCGDDDTTGPRESRLDSDLSHPEPHARTDELAETARPLDRIKFNERHDGQE